MQAMALNMNRSVRRSTVNVATRLDKSVVTYVHPPETFIYIPCSALSSFSRHGSEASVGAK